MTFLKKVLAAKRLGYKVMRHENGRAVSGADSRQSFPLKRRDVVRMPGQGIFLSLNKDYVLDNYAVHDDNVLITFEFDPASVTFGNLTDRETEFAVPFAQIVDYHVFKGEEE